MLEAGETHRLHIVAGCIVVLCVVGVSLVFVVRRRGEDGQPGVALVSLNAPALGDTERGYIQCLWAEDESRTPRVAVFRYLPAASYLSDTNRQSPEDLAKGFKNDVTFVVGGWPPDANRTGLFVDGRKLWLPKGMSVYFVSDSRSFRRALLFPLELEDLVAGLEEWRPEDFRGFLEDVILPKIDKGETSLIESLVWVPDVRLADVRPSSKRSHPEFSPVVDDFQVNWVVPQRWLCGEEGLTKLTGPSGGASGKFTGTLAPTGDATPLETVLAHVDEFAESRLQAHGVLLVHKGVNAKVDGGYTRTIRYAYGQNIGEITIRLGPNAKRTRITFEIKVNESPP